MLKDGNMPICEQFKEGEELENYTKYQLKPLGELADLLEGKDNLFVISCNKCFKEFDTTLEPEQEQFLKLAEGLDKTVVGTAKADFLCNETKATKGLPVMIPENAEHVVVISCGLGIQTVASIADKPVYSATNSVKKYAEGVSEVFDSRFGRQFSAHRIGVIAADEAPYRVAHNLAVQILPQASLGLTQLDELDDLVLPPKVVIHAR